MTGTEDPEPKSVRTVTELARVLGVAPSTAYGWKQKGMPKRRRGGFDVAAVRAWVATRQAARRAPAADEPDGDDPAPSRARTVTELARRLGVAPSTAYAWRKKGLPELDGGGFDVEAARAWVAAMRVSGTARSGGNPLGGAAVAATGTGAGISNSILDAKVDADLRQRKARAVLEELRVARASGSMVDRAIVAELLVERMMIFRRALDAHVREDQDRLVRAQTRGDVVRILERAHDAILTDAWGREPDESELEDGDR